MTRLLAHSPPHLSDATRRVLLALLIFLGWAATSACGEGSSEPLQPTATGGAGAAEATGTEAGAAGMASAHLEGGRPSGVAGAAGAAPYVDPRDCSGDHARITVPNPILSAGLSITASAGVENPEALIDGEYHASPRASLGVVSASSPAWVAIDVGTGPERLLLAWTDPGSSNYGTTSAGAPGAYTIETSADSTDGEDGTWDTVVTVEQNPVKARTHTFDFTGQRWVRMTVTAPGADRDASDDVEIDEIALYDVSASGDERPQDTWVFMGDSIVDGAFDDPTSSSSFATLVHESHAAYTPMMINAGIGGDHAYDGVEDIDDWLAFHADVTYFAIQYGTNDSWGNQRLGSTSFENDMRTIVESVLDAGRIPVLARIPYSNDGDHETVPDFNAVIDALTEEYDLPCGPDLYGHFLANPRELGADGVHPRAAGYRSMNALWAEAMTGLYVDP